MKVHSEKTASKWLATNFGLCLLAGGFPPSRRVADKHAIPPLPGCYQRTGQYLHVSGRSAKGHCGRTSDKLYYISTLFLVLDLWKSDPSISVGGRGEDTSHGLILNALKYLGPAVLTTIRSSIFDADSDVSTPKLVKTIDNLADNMSLTVLTHFYACLAGCSWRCCRTKRIMAGRPAS